MEILEQRRIEETTKNVDIIIMQLQQKLYTEEFPSECIKTNVFGAMNWLLQQKIMLKKL